jgi:hypothetical protein
VSVIEEKKMEKVEVAHPFYVGTRLMHAGTYGLSCDHAAGVILLTDEFGATIRLPALGIRINDECTGATQMDFIRDGNRLILHQVHLRDEGHVDVADLVHLADVVNIEEYRQRR